MRPYVWMVCAAVAFATMGGLAHALKDAFPWQVIALARSIVPLVLTGAFLLAARKPLPFRAPGILWSRSLAGSLSLVCTFYALTRLPVSDVLTLSNLVPLWVAIFAWPVLGQRQSLDVWLSILLGVAGVALSQQEFISQGNAASFITILASLASAVAMVSLHRVEGMDPWAIVCHFSAVSLVICLAFALTGMPDLKPAPFADWRLWLMLFGVGLSATIGQFFLTIAYIHGNPARVSVVGLSQVGFAMAIDLRFSDRPFSIVRFTGILMVLVSTAWVMLSLAGQNLGEKLESSGNEQDNQEPTRLSA